MAAYGGTIDKVPPGQTETDIFVHACLEPGISLPNQSSDYLRWKHVGGLELRRVSGKRTICGHTAQQDGVPLVWDGWACIDTYSHGGQWLTCLDTAANHVYQASQTGATREFPLAKYA